MFAFSTSFLQSRYALKIIEACAILCVASCYALIPGITFGVMLTMPFSLIRTYIAGFVMLAVYVNLKNNFIYFSDLLANLIFPVFDLPQKPIAEHISYLRLGRALQERYNRLLEEDYNDLMLGYWHDQILNINHLDAEALGMFLQRAKEEYKIYLNQIPRPPIAAIDILIGQPIHLQSWYNLHIAQRKVEWTLYKEIALNRIAKNSDDFVAGLNADQIAELEANEQWRCQINGLMRNPTYVIRGDGKRVYFELLNLEKWLSRPVANEELREILPENRERVLEYHLDLALKKQIEERIAQLRNQNLHKAELILEIIFTPLLKVCTTIYSLFDIMIDAIKGYAQIDQKTIDLIADPYSHISSGTRSLPRKRKMEKMHDIECTVFLQKNEQNAAVINSLHIDTASNEQLGKAIALYSEVAADITITAFNGYIAANEENVPMCFMYKPTLVTSVLEGEMPDLESGLVSVYPEISTQSNVRVVYLPI
jgi:hypothetical protein